MSAGRLGSRDAALEFFFFLNENLAAEFTLLFAAEAENVRWPTGSSGAPLEIFSSDKIVPHKLDFIN
jgi:hypothetical protein